MPLDLRTTIFSNAELVTALTEYARREQVDLPLTGPQGVELTWEPALSARLAFTPDAAGRVEALTFEKNEVAAALILYCHGRKEPVPHHAEKGLEPYKDNAIQLLLRFPWGEQWDLSHPARKTTFPSMREEGD